MGKLFHENNVLSWKATKGAVNKDVRRRAVTQFLLCWYNKDKKNDARNPPIWGDEIEHTLVKFDHDKRTVRLHLDAENIIDELNNEAGEQIWHPEFGRYQIESTPYAPYGPRVDDLVQVERSMLKRHEQLLAQRGENETMVNLTIFPRFMCSGVTYTEPPVVVTDPDPLLSQLYPSDILFPNPRYLENTRNQAHRLGKRVEFYVPVFRDSKTPNPLFKDGDGILADGMGAAGGFCALQSTIQAKDRDEARYLYDQFAALAPVLIALTAASPMYGGYLTDLDSRFGIQLGTTFEGDYEEMSDVPARSRYSSVACYCTPVGAEYNDVPAIRCQIARSRLLNAGVDEAMADHVSHILSHDSFAITADYTTPNSEDRLNHFNNIQGSVWQTARLKLAVPEKGLGWRVEVRPMEVQLTAFENAAFTSFIWLLSRAMVRYNMDFRIPISKLDENITQSTQRDAINRVKLHFRSHNPSIEQETDDIYNGGEYTINDILNGNEEFIGLVPLIQKYLSEEEVAENTSNMLDEYLDLISKRASGRLPTFAAWSRNFVRSHEDYKEDSEVSDAVQYDLLMKCDRITRGFEPGTELLGR